MNLKIDHMMKVVPWIANDLPAEFCSILTLSGLRYIRLRLRQLKPARPGDFGRSRLQMISSCRSNAIRECLLHLLSSTEIRFGRFLWRWYEVNLIPGSRQFQEWAGFPGTSSLRASMGETLDDIIAPHPLLQPYLYCRESHFWRSPILIQLAHSLHQSICLRLEQYKLENRITLCGNSPPAMISG